MEVAGIIASSLAYGRVEQIVKKAGWVLSRLEGSPAKVIVSESTRDLLHRIKGFSHRFTNDRELALFIKGVGKVIKRYGSLRDCFMSGYSPDDKNIIPALSFLTKQIKKEAGSPLSFLLPDPEKGSACKRLNLFARWMVRNDEIDPGCWNGIPPSKLLVPMDTHMHRISLGMGLTERTYVNIKLVLEVTEGFKKFCPDDPVKYDFALTRLGMMGGEFSLGILDETQRQHNF